MCVNTFKRKTIDLLKLVYNNFQLASDAEAYEAVDGIALHWYSDWLITDTVMDDLHNKYPDKLILYTESSINGEFGELTN